VDAVVRGRRAAEAFTAEGLGDRMHGWQHGARLIREEFTAASSERETELRERYGLQPPGRLQLTGTQQSSRAPREARPTDGHR
jgi:hypothetical protein